MIYIIKHKPYNNPVPKDYKELLVGDLFQYNDLDNINELNPYINEATGLYHIWKNCKDNIVGLCHYRKFFWDKYGALTIKDAKEILKNYDIIIRKDVVFQRSIYKQLRMEFENPDIYDKYYRRFCASIPGFEEFFDTDRFNNSEMFVCKRKTIEKYCKWLFPIVLPIVYEFIEKDAERVVNKRMIGHFVERLFSFWIQQNNLKSYRMEVSEI